MLVLTRKAGQQITLGDDIVLTVVKVDRNRVRLGIDAPNSVRILRQEVQIDAPESVPAIAETPHPQSGAYVDLVA